jgi:transcriptional regulator with XRE-family HTH domain
MVLEMAQEPIGQRIKFLIDSQKISVRRFAQTLDVGETNIRNYIDKGTKPSSDVLEKIVRAFPLVNLAWLITGEGQPYNAESGAAAEPGATYIKKNNRSQVTGSVGGDAYQNFLDPKFLQREIEILRSQLNDKERIIQLLQRLLNQEPKS